MRSLNVVLTLAAALSACTDDPSIAHEDALDQQAGTWCERIGHPDRFCEASFRYAYGYTSESAVSDADQQACLADMGESVRGADGWQCPASCDAIWLADGASGPIWP